MNAIVPKHMMSRVVLIGLTKQPLVVDPIGCFPMCAHFYKMGDPKTSSLFLLVDF